MMKILLKDESSSDADENKTWDTIKEEMIESLRAREFQKMRDFFSKITIVPNLIKTITM